MNNQPLEKRIQEANITYHALSLRPHDLYLKFRYYKALEVLNYEK